MKGTRTSGNKCIVTGKSFLSGNKVSHSKRRTRTKQCANIQTKKFWSVERAKFIPLTVSAKGIKIITKRGLEKVLRELEIKGYKF